MFCQNNKYVKGMVKHLCFDKNLGNQCFEIENCCLKQQCQEMTSCAMCSPLVCPKSHTSILIMRSTVCENAGYKSSTTKGQKIECGMTYTVSEHRVGDGI